MSAGGVVNGGVTVTAIEGPHAGGFMELRFHNYPITATTMAMINNLIATAVDKVAEGGA